LSKYFGSGITWLHRPVLVSNIGYQDPLRYVEMKIIFTSPAGLRVLRFDVGILFYETYVYLLVILLLLHLAGIIEKVN
jgi:hypothetical protein